jgi:phosphoglycolate phosphatase
MWCGSNGVNLLFDLDGTLTDPLPGIARSIQHALVTLGIAPPEIHELRRFIGPPLRASLAELIGSTDTALVSRAIAAYRERFATVGMFENTVYPGIVDELARFDAGGHVLWVVTSKPHVYANAIVDHFNLRRFFRSVYGSELDGRLVDKSELIGIVLRAEGIDADETWMIGDRAPDMRGGRENGTRTAAVLWGYELEEELVAAVPDVLVRSVADLGTSIGASRAPV